MAFRNARSCFGSFSAGIVSERICGSSCSWRVGSFVSSSTIVVDGITSLVICSVFSMGAWVVSVLFVTLVGFWPVGAAGVVCLVGGTTIAFCSGDAVSHPIRRMPPIIIPMYSVSLTVPPMIDVIKEVSL